MFASCAVASLLVLLINTKNAFQKKNDTEYDRLVSERAAKLAEDYSKGGSGRETPPEERENI